MTDCVRAVLVINDQCLDLKCLVLKEGTGILVTIDPISVAAGVLPMENLLVLRKLLKPETR